jgi:isopenicillin-N epimerase
LTGDQVALTDSTTLGAALVYGGLKLSYGDEIITTNQDYYITHESLRRAALRNGSVVRRIDLFDSIDTVSEAQMVSRLMAAITPRTRAFALTWVHSSTGLKLPLPAISAALAQVNATRQEPERIILAVDGVHGFGNQDATLASLGCDILMAGCHKWLFGPRGTGVIAANALGWSRLRPSVPSYVDSAAWTAWINNAPLLENTDGPLMSPGGFKAFEHLWSIPARDRISREDRQGPGGGPHRGTGQPAEGRARPGDASRAAGDAPRSPPIGRHRLVRRARPVDRRRGGPLRQRRIIASAAPYAIPARAPDAQPDEQPGRGGPGPGGGSRAWRAFKGEAPLTTPANGATGPRHESRRRRLPRFQLRS